jgi:hypothetical protein
MAGTLVHLYGSAGIADDQTRRLPLRLLNAAIVLWVNELDAPIH